MSQRRWLVPATVFIACWTLTTHGKYPVSGDEPHYLMVAEASSSCVNRPRERAGEIGPDSTRRRLVAWLNLKPSAFSVPRQTTPRLRIGQGDLRPALARNSVEVEGVAKAVAEDESSIKALRQTQKHDPLTF